MFEIYGELVFAGFEKGDKPMSDEYEDDEELSEEELEEALRLLKDCRRIVGEIHERAEGINTGLVEIAERTNACSRRIEELSKKLKLGADTSDS